MIGLMFMGILSAWFAISIALGVKIPKWMGVRRFGWVFSLLLTPLIFLTPVADEVIAYPQMVNLCASLKPYDFTFGVDEKSAYGRTVYHKQSNTRELIWPPTVEVKKWTSAYVDSKTGEPILVQNWFEPQRGMLGVPNGSSGGRMTILLKSCSPKNTQYDSRGRPNQFESLNLKEIQTP